MLYTKRHRLAAIPALPGVVGRDGDDALAAVCTNTLVQIGEPAWPAAWPVRALEREAGRAADDALPLIDAWLSLKPVAVGGPIGAAGALKDRTQARYGVGRREGWRRR